MNRLLVVAVSLFVVGCTVPYPTNGIDRWSVNGFQVTADAPGDEVLGRWQRQDLLIAPGSVMPFWQPPFRPAGPVTGDRPLLTIWPAFAEGQPHAFVITDIWANQPRPWVQPVYMGVKDYDARPVTVVSRSIFPVAPGASFYSPFWRAEYYLSDGSADGAFETTVEVLDSHLDLSAGPLIYCPLVPSEIGVSNPLNAQVLTHPFTGTAYRPIGYNVGYVNRSFVTYLDLRGGLDPAPSEGDVVSDSPMYLFTKVLDDPQHPLPLPAVLPDDPIHHALVRVVDVQLPSTASVFLPASMLDAGVNYGTEDGGLAYEGFALRTIDLPDEQVRPYTLRVFMNAGCLDPDAGTFPSGCDWLDNAARIEQLSSSLRHSSDITAAIGVLKEAP
jgi:hypothetical protein